MPVTPELHAQILRYYHVERWRVGTIARQLQVHHGTVQRILRQSGLPPSAQCGSAALTRICPSSWRRSISFQPSRQAACT